LLNGQHPKQMMTNDSSIKKIVRELKDNVKDAVGTVRAKAKATREAIRAKAWELRARIVGKQVTVYPSYGYLDPADETMWVVPMRVWVHDNRDTPFVEEMIERWAIGHFETDLQRPLEDDEGAPTRMPGRLHCRR
jgi:hypothetical protein